MKKKCLPFFEHTFTNFHYGTVNVIIHTYHQPLTYAFPNKNNISKFIRLKAILYVELYHSISNINQLIRYLTY